MKQQGIPFDKVKSPFFISQKGKAFMAPKINRLKWGDFAEMSGMTEVTSMTFRHNMSNVLKAQKDSLRRSSMRFAIP